MLFDREPTTPTVPESARNMLRNKKIVIRQSPTTANLMMSRNFDLP